jgi:hypothetical protein
MATVAIANGSRFLLDIERSLSGFGRSKRVSTLPKNIQFLRKTSSLILSGTILLSLELSIQLR